MEARSLNNIDFPSVGGKDFINAMKKGEILQSKTIHVDCSRKGRVRAACRSPMAVAYEYIHMITNVFTTVLF